MHPPKHTHTHQFYYFSPGYFNDREEEQERMSQIYKEHIQGDRDIQTDIEKDIAKRGM